MGQKNILVLNSGSSSIKCALFQFASSPQIWSAPIWEKEVEWQNTKSAASIEAQIKTLLVNRSIDLIGHRVVHGGKSYVKTTRIDAKLKAHIRSLETLAPLHNKADLVGIDALERLYPQAPQFAVFDTAFHKTLPEAARVYPGPYQWYEEGIQRFGFHGISFQYCSRKAAEMLGVMPQKMVICHLGSGASLCALQNGVSIDTTMGFTPLEGVMMGTRSGTIDPGILLYLLQSCTPQQIAETLYHKSGLLGISGISSDMRDVLRCAQKADARAQLAIDMYVHRLSCAIGAMSASLQGLDSLVFTGGIGENAEQIRNKVCQKLAFLGISLPQNPQNPGDCILSRSQVQVLLIHTQEAFEIAKECWETFHAIH